MELAREGVLFLIDHKLLDQKKVEGNHCVESGIWRPQRHKYLTHGADLLLHADFVDFFNLGVQNLCTHFVSKHF